MKKGIEVTPGHDLQGDPVLRVRKAKGKLTLDEITEACMEYDQDFYMLVIKAIDRDGDQYYDTEDLSGDDAVLYRAGKFFKWREKEA